jgi:hypothetical protein
MITDIISSIVDTIQGLLAGIGSGIVTYFESLIIDRAAGVDTILNTADDVISLNQFGVFVFVLLGVGAAFGLAKVVFSLVRGRA